MLSKTTFTGRTRRRSTSLRVRVGDLVARVLITMGGIGTIVAVLLVCVFLLSVAFPLFRAPTIGPPRATLHDVTPTGPVALGADESGSVVWSLESTGRMMVSKAVDGAVLAVLTPDQTTLSHMTAVSVEPGTLDAVIGFEDGSFRTGRIGLESTFLAATDVPASLASIPKRGVGLDGDTIVFHSQTGQFSRIVPVCELLDPSSGVTGAPLQSVDCTKLTSGSLVAVLDSEGGIRVEFIESRRNLLTDEVIVTTSGAVIAPTSMIPASFVRLSSLGDQVFIVWDNGLAERWDIRTIESPRLAESFNLTNAPTRIVAMEHLFGGMALAAADSDGIVNIWTGVRSDTATSSDGVTMTATKTFSGDGTAITALAPSPRSRLLAVASASGMLRLLYSTNSRLIQSLDTSDSKLLGGSASTVIISPRENRLIAATQNRMVAWEFNAGFPEVSFVSLFRPLWYENYPSEIHAWETTGHESFESKFGLMPLIFGTLKATLFSMLFAVPIALCAAIYSSQFMTSRWKNRVKPVIELMAGLPSVVLGFFAGLVLAPLVEQGLMPILTSVFLVPLTILAGAHFWQIVPSGLRSKWAGFRFALVSLVAIPLGCLCAHTASPTIERLLFQGDIQAWLDGRGGSGLGGWMLALLPFSGILAMLLLERLIGPVLRRVSQDWSEQQAALVLCGKFLVSVGLTLAIAMVAGMFFDSLRFDTRGGLFGTYVQRNALVVGIGMSFAIIPLIFTIADDALSSVPEHLRSASLGAGATPWQTAVRVIIPTAASGLFSAVMIGLGRAVGETMIVLMAAGNTPIMGWNIFNGFQTLSAAIATELPEAARGTSHYRVLFLAAVVLFFMTFVVNTIAEFVRQRFRRRFHEL